MVGEHTAVGRELKLGRKCPHNTKHKIAPPPPPKKEHMEPEGIDCPIAMMLYMLLLNTDSSEGNEEEELGGGGNNLKCYLPQGSLS